MSRTETSAGSDVVPTVTVLVPVYNAQAYLIEALASISAQTFRDLEILVIDDGSTDTSAQLLADFSRTEPRLRVLRQPNAGISAALNAGLAVARGEFIVRMDADDVMLARRVQTQVDFLLARPALGFCACDMNMIDSAGRVFGSYRPQPRSEPELRQMMADRLPIVYTHPTVTCRTALLRAAGGYDRRYEPCEDMQLFGRLLLAGHAGVVLPELLMHYRVHGASISGSKIAVQVRTQEFVRAAFYAQLEGRVLDRVEHDRQLRHASWPERMRARARERSEVLRKMSHFATAAGQRIRAALYLARAAAYRPGAALRAVWRRLAGSSGAAVARRASGA